MGTVEVLIIYAVDYGTKERRENRACTHKMQGTNKSEESTQRFWRCWCIAHCLVKFSQLWALGKVTAIVESSNDRN